LFSRLNWQGQRESRAVLHAGTRCTDFPAVALQDLRQDYRHQGRGRERIH
jgi:hypothetical protein